MRVLRIRNTRGTGTLRSARRDLWQFDPRCYWCMRVTAWNPAPNGALAPDDATVDHLEPAWERKARYTNVVLSCAECNFRRGTEVNKQRQNSDWRIKYYNNWPVFNPS